MSRVTVIIKRLENHLSHSPSNVHELYHHLNAFKNGTTYPQLNNVLRKKQFKQEDGKWNLLSNLSKEMNTSLTKK